MQPIPTEYKGTKFRSRTEARWAIFMNSLGVRYDYELEGYDLNGLFYLPDFWLPEQEIFLEIKPASPTNEEIEKALRLATYTKRKVFIQWGAPRLPEFGIDEWAYCIFPDDGEDHQYWWCECPNCHKVG